MTDLNVEDFMDETSTQLVTLEEAICGDCPFDNLSCVTFARDPEMHCVQALGMN